MSLILLLARGPSTYSLTATTGDFAVSGQQAGLLSGWMLSANTGAFTLTGIDSSLRYFSMPASAGSFTLTGNDVGTYVGRALAADAGSFTVTAVNVILTKEPIMTASPYRTPQSGLLLAIPQSGESFIVSGSAPSIYASRVMPAAAGDFSVTGNDAALPVSMPVDPGSFAMTFNDASIYATRFITADGTSFAITFNPAGLSTAWSTAVDLFRSRQTFLAADAFTRDR